MTGTLPVHMQTTNGRGTSSSGAGITCKPCQGTQLGMYSTSTTGTSSCQTSGSWSCLQERLAIWNWASCLVRASLATFCFKTLIDGTACTSLPPGLPLILLAFWPLCDLGLDKLESLPHTIQARGWKARQA